MKIATLIVSRNRPDLVTELVDDIKQYNTFENDIYLVECGTDANNLTEYTTLWYEDKDFKGKCFGHNLLLDYVQSIGKKYDYFLITMNDVFMQHTGDPIAELVRIMEENKRIGILSPTNLDGLYPGSQKQNKGDSHVVTTCDYLCFLMRSDALSNVGFLNRYFKYCWGAIHELSYKLYKEDWTINYCDTFSYNHLGGSTYGAKDTQTISREEYQYCAKKFAAQYFLENYGVNWDSEFWEICKSYEISQDTYKTHRQLWDESLRE